MKETTATRLQQLMSERGLKQVDILRLTEPHCKAHKIKMNRSDISQYVNGKVAPSQWKLTILGLALNVSEGWLMGLDVPRERDTDIHAAPSSANKSNTLTLGAVVSGFRMQERMTVEQFAALSGLSVEDVAMLERHLDPKTGQPITPDLDVYAAVAKAMGTTTDELRFIANGTRDVPQEQKASYQLTDDEEKLIKVYRRLPTDKKKSS